MSGNKIRFRNTVAVGEDQIIAISGGNGLVEDLAFAKAVVLLPVVIDRQYAALAIIRYYPLGVIAGAVVGDQHPKVAGALVFIASEHLGQPEGGIVGGDHYADGIWSHRVRGSR